MTEEIKEILESYLNHNEIEIILDRIKEIVDNEIIDYGEELTLSECKCLLNYITNLQKENEDYKSRNEKVIKLLKTAGCYDEETKTFCDEVWDELDELLNILQGGDE